jgi:hypothetical protein
MRDDTDGGGRRPALPAGRPGAAGYGIGARGGGSWGNHGFPHALNAPRPALVETAVGGEPRLVDRELVTVVREEWRVVDRWWTDDPVDRRYFEVVLESGRNVCVYRDGERRCWFAQRA